MSKVFLDTNILVYATDASSPGKRSKCRDLIRSASHEGRGVISTQVLQECYVVLTRKLGVDPVQAKGIVQRFANLEVVVIDPPLIQEAIDCSILTTLSFWDALIVVSAESAQCQSVWTEDMSDGQVVRGVRIENPLS
jgi:predicted nucleic acid-binding protein